MSIYDMICYLPGSVKQPLVFDGIDYWIWDADYSQWLCKKRISFVTQSTSYSHIVGANYCTILHILYFRTSFWGDANKSSFKSHSSHSVHSSLRSPEASPETCNLLCYVSSALFFNLHTSPPQRTSLALHVCTPPLTLAIVKMSTSLPSLSQPQPQPQIQSPSHMEPHLTQPNLTAAPSCPPPDPSDDRQSSSSESDHDDDMTRRSKVMKKICSFFLCFLECAS